MSQMDRRSFLINVAAGSAMAASLDNDLKAGSAHPLSDGSPGVATGLAPAVFFPLPLGSIRPLGWLRRQLQVQADGLTGHLDEFWPDVGRSKWFGGDAEGWERAPYWLDGAIPLAWMLPDKSLQGRISKYIDYIITHQRPDGWYSPYPEDAVSKRYDLWAILLANKVLVLYHNATGDERALRSVQASLRAMLDGLDRTPLYDWGKYRWFEGLVSIFYVYERTGEPWLLELGRKLRAQGFDYQEFYRGDDVTVPTPRRGLW